jgi:general secretion pathway protein G
MPRPKKKSLLIVDADVRLAKIYAGRFEEVGWRVLVTQKVADAKKRIARLVPDALMIDPTQEGADFQKELREDPKTAAVVQVVLTNAVDRNTIARAVVANADAYFLKSHTAPGQVVRKIKQLLDMNTQKKSVQSINDQSGFTLVELLVVIAIVALVIVFAAIAVDSARSKQRDVTRLSNVRQVQSALEDFFNESNAYPNGEMMPLGDVAQSACLGASGFAADCVTSDSTFLRVVPGAYEDGLDSIVTCGEPARRAFCYSKRQDGESYVIYFELENNFGPVGLQSGVNCATPEGMEAGICPE